MACFLALRKQVSIVLLRNVSMMGDCLNPQAVLRVLQDASAGCMACCSDAANGAEKRGNDIYCEQAGAREGGAMAS